MPPTTVRHGHYKMMGGICLSVCLSVCLSRASTQLDNGKAYEDKKSAGWKLIARVNL